MNEKFDKFFIAKLLRYSLIPPICVRNTFFSGLPSGTELENFEEHMQNTPNYCNILQNSAKYCNMSQKYYKIPRNNAK
jgi:hypothetical protein